MLFYKQNNKIKLDILPKLRQNEKKIATLFVRTISKKVKSIDYK